MGAFMRWGDHWEKPWHSIPITAIPAEPTALLSAVALVIEKRPGADDAGDRSSAISCRGEFINMWYGGSKLKTALAEKAELARAEGIQSAARNWIKEQLKTGKLRLFRDGGPLQVWVCEPQFWQRGEE
jgi:hypothetical protein